MRCGVHSRLSNILHNEVGYIFDSSCDVNVICHKNSVNQSLSVSTLYGLNCFHNIIIRMDSNTTKNEKNKLRFEKLRKLHTQRTAGM